MHTYIHACVVGCCRPETTQSDELELATFMCHIQAPNTDQTDSALTISCMTYLIPHPRILHTYKQTYMHTHIHTCIHTYTHNTYIHTCEVGCCRPETTQSDELELATFMCHIQASNTDQTDSSLIISYMTYHTPHPRINGRLCDQIPDHIQVSFPGSFMKWCPADLKPHRVTS